MPTILLIRHAQASFGAANYDWLSDRGHAQTVALVTGLKRRGIRADRVISGSLRRQRDTASVCARCVAVDTEIDERWNEYADRDIVTRYGLARTSRQPKPDEAPLSSREFQDVLEHALRRWIDAGEHGSCEETWPRFQARVRTALTDLAGDLGKGQTALVVSSGGVIGTLTASLMHLPPTALVEFNHVSINTGITKLAVGGTGTHLISSNEHAHLDEANPGLITFR